MRTLAITILLTSLLTLAGCQTAEKATQEVGKPVGKAFDVVGGLSEGALEGYMDEEKDNPYGR